MPLPKEGARVADRHAQTIPFPNIHHPPPFVWGWAEYFFLDRIHAVLIVSQVSSTSGGYGMNPTTFYVKIGTFLHILAPGVSCAKKKKKLNGYSLCIHVLIYC